MQPVPDAANLQRVKHKARENMQPVQSAGRHAL